MVDATPTKRKRELGDVFEIVHARIFRFFPELVVELGGDPEALIREVGMSPESLLESKSAATYRQLIGLIEHAAARLECTDFGMRLAARQGGGGMFGPLGEAMQNSRTFGDALAYVGEHAYAHSLAARIWHKRSRADRTIFAGHDILLDRLPNKAQAMEQILLLGHLAAMEMTGGHARVRRVHFRHQPVSPLKTYRDYFGCEVRFGQNEDGVVFTERDLACQIIARDEKAYAEVTSFIDKQFTQHVPPLRAQTRGVIMQLLGAEYCTNDHVAAELSMHPRTLHRRLKAEGTSFQEIKDEVRRDLLLYYLRETSLDFTLISARLGFSEQSVMTRRCNQWFSASPTKLRAQRRLASPAN